MNIAKPLASIELYVFRGRYGRVWADVKPETIVAVSRGHDLLRECVRRSSETLTKLN